ncbi:tubulin polymerization-promoting protein family member 2-like [Saccoglossus kowalevskii]|uniref:Tubulin polymerization-promoting protein family member 2-like n=1 Tax=Saccoglossus kowalevskii TaxID=10224 RepID=A0ABM0H0Q6_SACKO|nr:PREDICTED: tubulin polymerization-promoting protein family member 2-like [Saccoglossus kowalevskii]
MSKSLEEVFKEYCSFGKGAKGANELDNKNWTKLCKDKGLIDKKMNGTEVDMIHTRCKTKGGRTLNFAQFQQALAQAGKAKYGKESDENTKKIEDKVLGGGGPATSGTTGAVKAGGVDRLTDASKYTGSHKERFDASGKGKGIDGRVDKVDSTGYVGNYKGEGTYDKK